MSGPAQESAASPEAEEMLPPFPKGSPRTLQRRLLTQNPAAYRLDDPAVVPYGARLTLTAVVEMVAGSDDGVEYRADAELDRGRGLVELVARRAKAAGAEAEVSRHLQALALVGLIAATEEGGLRLGIYYPPPSKRTLANRANGKQPKTPRAQKTAFLVFQGGKLDGSQTEAKTEPNGSQMASQMISQMASQAEATALANGFDLASRAVAAAAAKEESIDSKESLAATTAADSVPPARAESHGEAKTQAKTGAAGSHGGFDLASGLASNEAKPALADGTPQPPAEAAFGKEAFVLAEEMANQFKLAPGHRAEAPSIMQSYLDAGYSAEQVRAALALKAGSRLVSARVLGKILGGKFPDVAYAAAAPAKSQGEAPAKNPYHPDCARLPGFARVSVGTQTAASRLLTALEGEDAAWRARSVAFTADKFMDAFRLVATIRPELWELAGKDPPAPQAAMGDLRMS